MNKRLFIKYIIFLTITLSYLTCFSQTYKIEFGDTINRTDKNGLKQGFWIEEIKDKIYAGNYKNNLKDDLWRLFSLDGTIIKGWKYSNGKKLYGIFILSQGHRNIRILRLNKKSNDNINKISKNDSNLIIRLFIINNSVYSKSINQINSFLDDVKIKVIELSQNNLNNYSNIDENKKVIIENVESIVDEVPDFGDTTSKFKRIYYDLNLRPNSEYLIIMSLDKFLTKRIIINTNLNSIPFSNIGVSSVNVSFSNRIINTYDPIILGRPSQKFIFTKYGFLSEDISYRGLSKILLQRKSDFELKLKTVELENSVNEEINSLKQEQLELENEKKLKEEELKLQEEENKRKRLELELLSKDKAVSDLTIKAREAELLKSTLLANEKKKEIENLNQQKIINELNIKNKEAEINRKNIEAENKQKQILGLKKEKELSVENLKQQKFIQKITFIGSLVLLLFLVYVFYNLFKSKQKNKLIQKQKQEVEKQKEVVEEQNHLIKEKQKEILDSIHYAKRLQEAILPPLKFIDEYVPNNFVLYHPKDVVAGDFYWAETKDNKFFIAAADCTGHGVPGAMVSVVCSNALNRTVNEFGITETGKILDKTRELVLETFAKGNAEVKDGMDISLLCIDKQNNKAFWSGANNPLWYVQSSDTSIFTNTTVTSSEVEKSTDAGLDSARPYTNVGSANLVEIKADKQPIGKSDYAKPFTTHEIALQEGMLFYLFTDGYADQFGGPKGKKFKYKQLEELLLANANKKMHEQQEILNQEFSFWKGDLEQVDDVCVIGVRV